MPVRFKKKKKNQVKSPSPESRVPETGSDPPIGSDRDSGRDNPYGIHNTWLSLFSLGLSSSETTTLKTFRAASHVGPVTLRLLRGGIAEVDIAASAWAVVGPSGP